MRPDDDETPNAGGAQKPPAFQVIVLVRTNLRVCLRSFRNVLESGAHERQTNMEGFGTSIL